MDKMVEPLVVPGAKSPSLTDGHATDAASTASWTYDENNAQGPPTPYLSSNPASPVILSRHSSYFGSHSLDDDLDDTPPDKFTLFDFFENLTLSARVERWQAAVQAQREKLKRQQERMRNQTNTVRDRAVAEFKKRVPSSEEQLSRYRSRMKKSVDDLNKRWKDTVTITVKEKVSFLTAVINIFFSGYLIGAVPEKFYWWYTIQVLYFIPMRYVTYHRKGYHYFLADLCYFVNALLCLSIWAFPQSKRLFIATWCLAFGNNAVAIVMWRNSLVFHSMDKVVSLFIHVMPPVTLHCIAHLTPDKILLERFPAAYTIKFSQPGSPEHYTLPSMLLWATLPYAVWQLSYHFLITVRRAQQIKAGRPTSFTWLRKSYAKTWIGRVITGLPEAFQEPAFMLIQYSYACLTIIPCPIWFWYRWPSAGFLLFIFGWSVWNGANYYMDVFGKRFERELEQMKKDVARWQGSPGHTATAWSPATHPNDATSPVSATGGDTSRRGSAEALTPMQMMKSERSRPGGKRHSLDSIPLLDTMTTDHDVGREQAKVTGAEVTNNVDDSSIMERRVA